MKIKNKLVKGKVVKLFPNIYGVVVDNYYDRAMLFCRYQEYYESPFKNIRGKYFTLEEYMRTYVKENKKNYFTYPYDWSGYNIPSTVFNKACDVFYKETEYDKVMNDIRFYCENDAMESNDGTSCKWYLIGYGSENDSVLSHEIAHALYFTNKDYKIEMDEAVSKIKKKDYNFIKKQLIKIGYADDKKIIDDEIQAFVSTGLYGEFDTDVMRSYQKEFKKIYNKYV
jgi:hypothetical protein